MGRQAVQWIRTAHYQLAYLGLYSGWNWEVFAQDISRLEFPNRHLIKEADGTKFKFIILPILTKMVGHVDSNSYTLPSPYNSSVSDLFSDIGSVTSDEDIIMEETEYGKQLEYPSERLALKTSQAIGALSYTPHFQPMQNAIPTTLFLARNL